MHEVFPLLAGVAVALLVQRLSDARIRTAALVVVSTVIGFAASAVSGELRVSWAFLPLDMLEVMLAAVGTVLVLAARQRRLATLTKRV